MRLNRKSEYALVSLAHLAISGTTDPVSVREMAAANEIPRRFLEAIMRELRDMGLVESVAGKRGGYRLLKAPALIRLGEVLRRFDGRLERPGDCATRSSTAAAPIMVLYREIDRQVDRLMDETTLADVVERWREGAVLEREERFILGQGI